MSPYRCTNKKSNKLRFISILCCQLKKKTRETEKADHDMDSMMKRIEKKAMASFKKDLQTNPLLQQAALEKKMRRKSFYGLVSL